MRCLSLDIRFDGQMALIVGGSRGLGKCIAQTLAQSGADIIITDVLDAEGAEACDSICAMGRSARYAHTDVTDMTQVQSLFSSISHIDIVINCVGITMTDTLLEASQEKIQRLFNINILGLIKACVREIIILETLSPKRVDVPRMLNIYTTI